MNLINDVLDLSLLEAGERTLNKEDVTVRDVVSDCTPIIIGAVSSKGIKFIDEVPEDIGSVHADKRALKQILLNLLSNAVKFTPVDGNITIRAMTTNTHHIIEVINTGDSIPAEKIATLTEPFVRSESNPLKTQEGTGLGLAIVKSLLDLHNGELDIESEDGKGTMVKVKLPSGNA